MGALNREIEKLQTATITISEMESTMNLKEELILLQKLEEDKITETNELKIAISEMNQESINLKLKVESYKKILGELLLESSQAEREVSEKYIKNRERLDNINFQKENIIKEKFGVKTTKIKLNLNDLDSITQFKILELNREEEKIKDELKIIEKQKNLYIAESKRIENE